MKKTGVAYLPLHGGRCPPWLFRKMVRLSKAICEIILQDFGRKELLRRFSNPFFFQSLGCVVGFDYHSSGLTTTLTGALKEALSLEEHGVAVCGGKGKASRLTLEEIEKYGSKFSFSSKRIDNLKYCSRIVAKVDTSAVQSGYNLYHHAFFISEDGSWAVVQQGLNPKNRFARRYHWLSEKVQSFVLEPHSGFFGERIEDVVLNLTSYKSVTAQKVIVDVAKEGPMKVRNMVSELNDKLNVTLMDWIFPGQKKVAFKNLIMPVSVDWNVIRKLYEFQPKNFEEVLMTYGVGPSTVRALALISNLIYGAEVDWEDPIKYSFCVGGKDGVPYPVDKKAYEESIKFLRDVIEGSEIGLDDRKNALKRLNIILTKTF
ncbi:MAG: DUF763 domain-containing protein [Nitrososphaeria archaeon]|nr:DUF763 domain-containing protein [Nitrososphaeria archaeon]